ncbi:MAG TPA: endonuclease Q family protein [Bacillus sp. (in: firmicutes)]|uniref:endonuclease Q family protein n=1 Tax=Bacillus litorisediminis TaxID=2922713 RepID=UPI001FACCFDF|nr:endonuclease Q family protein [Bacillus litorisediminis]HWO75789.1 endonuclease Q family protein [Bacillus sp. (in: firmicutes)]
MRSFFADLHIHIGRTSRNQAVKITASDNLTLVSILDYAKQEKGLDVVGIIDCHSPGVLEDIQFAIQQGKLEEHKDGGLVTSDSLLLIMGAEVEIYDEFSSGPIHILCFFPYVDKMAKFSKWLQKRVTNIHLSSQRAYASGKELQEIVKELDGLFIPAHIFTPFKSLFGKGVHKSLTEVLDPEKIDAVELGLSSNTEMAYQIEEIRKYPFLTNSDAHSLQKMGREYQKLQMEELSYKELVLAIKGLEGRFIEANYGLDPRIGKYHQTVCANCFQQVTSIEEPCPYCGHKRIVKGVKERIEELRSTEKVNEIRKPPYFHQVPLENLPGIGPKLLKKLISAFGNEMNVLHFATEEDLRKVAGEKVTTFILAARYGTLTLETGGGGRYGKVTET